MWSVTFIKSINCYDLYNYLTFVALINKTYDNYLYFTNLISLIFNKNQIFNWLL
ncbi:hypothetical protein VCRA2119O147_550008 [Vibrio crassostreae]|nr:hypothetical protein VCRA2118O144_420015 [Vibrio crassostreae]CAK2119204.1 hypothetical protein VCRA2119O145_470006 [Vibrio crassostreae]CAK2363888.1 hypothetical protein VCRA2117O142_420024 [Vibrio crassostreae]CAK2365405.1 hypothetical protein VCRA2117O143_460024 [Vibrio crassostreae]CAK2371212.1 hypothetical protein VCRA2119O147_550008 [Vibrio crassostreae]